MGENIREFMNFAIPVGRRTGKHEKSLQEKFRSRLRETANASEMYCSLKYEDVRGCPYNTFTYSQIACLSFALCAISAISIALGA